MLLGSAFEVAGMFLVGRHEAHTVKSDIINVDLFTDSPEKLALGMLCVIITATVWILFCSMFSLPISTTHAVVAAVVGFSLAFGGTPTIQWLHLGLNVLAWLLSPVVGVAIGYFVFFFINKLVLEHPESLSRTFSWLPFFTGVSLGLWVFFIVISLEYLDVFVPTWGQILAFVITFLLSLPIVRWAVVPVLRRRRGRREAGLFGEIAVEEDWDYQETNLLPDSDRTEVQFRPLSLLTTSAVVFAHGCNNSSNILGPLTAIWEFKDRGIVTDDEGYTLPMWTVTILAMAIVLGLVALGYKVVETVGTRITELTHSRAFTVQLTTAFVIMLATLISVPLSLSHVLVGSVVGVGLVRSRREATIEKRLLLKIGIGWATTVIASFFISMVLFFALSPFI